MGKRLYVGSLPFETTEDELHSLFNAVGTVESAKLITDRYTGRSKGFGFVEMADDTGAQQAIQKMNGSQVGSRKIVVSEARPLEQRSPNGNSRGGDRGGYGSRRY
ncbi:MAG: RNA-binding protein [Elusimicrobia bacterium]|nr:RNA-binding protein [Elusimicrobiota bacterium]